MIGGAGQDQLTGGLGSDIFKFYVASESKLALRDSISDFARGADKIDLSSIDANVYATGDQAFKLIGSSAKFTDAGQIKFAAGVLYGEVTGDNIADFAVTLTGVAALATTDFLL